MPLDEATRVRLITANFVVMPMMPKLHLSIFWKLVSCFSPRASFDLRYPILFEARARAYQKRKRNEESRKILLNFHFLVAGFIDFDEFV